jgi:hypothetical protein
LRFKVAPHPYIAALPRISVLQYTIQKIPSQGQTDFILLRRKNIQTKTAGGLRPPFNLKFEI